jgi:hypothetical protein
MNTAAALTIWSFGVTSLASRPTASQHSAGHRHLGRLGSFLGRICDGRGRNGRSDRCGLVMPPITPGITAAADCLASDRNGTRGTGSCWPAPLRHPAVAVASTPPTSQLHTLASSVLASASVTTRQIVAIRGRGGWHQHAHTAPSAPAGSLT